MSVSLPNEASVKPTATRLPVGRFAPSPTGNLHLGSLTTAIASFCHIKSLQGNWLLRIEDTDLQRCTRQFSDQILLDLERLGLHWDDAIWYQSQRTELYNDALYSKLRRRIYGCDCSRKQLQGFEVYPRYCLTPSNTVAARVDSLHDFDSSASNFPSSNFSANDSSVNNFASTLPSLEALKVRVQLPDYSIGFLDKLQGPQWVNPQQTLGDVVLRRADGTINYFLAVSLDDGLQGVTHVMRGLDILPLTTAQIALMSYFDLPAVQHWYHLPLVENQQGQKLSKQNLAIPIDTSSVTKCQALIRQALTLLKQPPVFTDSPTIMMAQAISQWQHSPLKSQQVLGQVDSY